MEIKQPFSIENISVVWLTIGGLVLCSGILIGLIFIGRTFLKDKTGTVAASPTTLIVQAETVSPSTFSQYPSSNSASLVQ
jgi:hypothetical protein